MSPIFFFTFSKKDPLIKFRPELMHARCVDASQEIDRKKESEMWNLDEVEKDETWITYLVAISQFFITWHLKVKT
jgi:hypothetical protein